MYQPWKQAGCDWCSGPPVVGWIPFDADGRENLRKALKLCRPCIEAMLAVYTEEEGWEYGTLREGSNPVGSDGDVAGR